MASSDNSINRANPGPVPKGKTKIWRQGQTEAHYGTDSKQEGLLSGVRDSANLGKDA